jgi:hypothetical protein
MDAPMMTNEQAVEKIAEVLDSMGLVLTVDALASAMKNWRQKMEKGEKDPLTNRQRTVAVNIVNSTVRSAENLIKLDCVI